MIWCILVQCQRCFVRLIKFVSVCYCLLCIVVFVMRARGHSEGQVKAHGTPQINQLEQEQAACLNFTCCGMTKPWINKDQIKAVCVSSIWSVCVCVFNPSQRCQSSSRRAGGTKSTAWKIFCSQARMWRSSDVVQDDWLKKAFRYQKSSLKCIKLSFWKSLFVNS